MPLKDNERMELGAQAAELGGKFMALAIRLQHQAMILTWAHTNGLKQEAAVLFDKLVEDTKD